MGYYEKLMDGMTDGLNDVLRDEMNNKVNSGNSKELDSLRTKLNKYKKDPIVFCEEVIGVKLNNFQKKIILEIKQEYDKGQRLYCVPSKRNGVEIGKSLGCALYCLYGRYILWSHNGKNYFIPTNDTPKPLRLKVELDT